jgi:intein-encoded DNA endonuclease-like protein
MTIKPSEYQHVIEQYHKIGNLTKVGKMFDSCRHQIKRILQLNNISIIPTGQVRRLYKNLKENYFDVIDTQEKAYFLGLLWADGCNMQKARFRIALGLQEEDGHIVNEFCKAIYGNTDKVKKYDRTPKKQNAKYKFRQKPRVILEFSSETMSKQLSILGMTPCKSLTARWPNNLPNNLIRHFIRGYYDGDGCITSTNRNYYSIQIIGSQVFIERMVKYVKEQTGIESNIYNLKTTSAPMSSLRLNGNQKCKTFLDWLYKKSTVQLKRKHGRYIDLLRFNKIGQTCSS